ncbi:MAG: Gfo/Idh/MocA family protein [Candidatus Hadarchaeia archaeon]
MDVKNVGLIGYKFMGKAHSHGYKDVPFFYNDLETIPKRKVICGRTEEAVAEAAEKYGWEDYATDWRDVVKDPEIDVIDVASPTFTHRDITVAAAEEGKDIFCEKPPARNFKEAKDMYEAVQESGVKNMIGFNYRRVPAIALAKELIEEGYIGDIRHFRGLYLQDWIMDPEFPVTWHLKKEKAGAGAHIDLNTHLIDLSRHLVGEHEKVVGMTETFIEERPRLGEGSTFGAEASEGKEEVEVDDATIFMTKFENGAIGHFEATRFAGGRKNHEDIEINGSKGSIKFNFEEMNRLKFYSTEDPDFLQGFKDILVTEEDHPYVSVWWPPGHLVGYENTFVNEFADFYRSYDENTDPKPDFKDALECQRVVEAVLRSSEEERWLEVSEIQ